MVQIFLVYQKISISIFESRIHADIIQIKDLIENLQQLAKQKLREKKREILINSNKLGILKKNKSNKCRIENGAWPSGKATGFDPAIRRFESFRPRAYSVMMAILFESKLLNTNCISE
ncbi:hypothetical protein Lal_00033136 [Lupinus albus]|nr:hypothetical protein Lal_00033136 [Lupinus albus]